MDVRAALLPLQSTLILLMFVIVTSYARTVDTGKCKFQNYNPDHPLSNIQRIKPLFGKTFTSYTENYEFHVGICTDLKSGHTGDPGAIQIEKHDSTTSSEDTENVFNIGSLSNSHLMTGSDWALLEYKDGDAYNGHCSKEKKRTSILLNCDETIGDDEAKMVFIEEERNKMTECYYLFEMKHKALCPLKSSGASTLSIGSILVIVFVSVLGVYLLVGFIYQRFVLGSKGIEQIPNYEFWKDFGNLQADGCDLVCRTKGRQNLGFRGIGDEQLDPTEEVRDDNLLPM